MGCEKEKVQRPSHCLAARALFEAVEQKEKKGTWYLCLQREIIIKPQRTSLKQRIAGGARTYLICVLVSAIIYLFVVVENVYQDLLEGKADTYTITAWILFIGFLIFLIVKISPIFGKTLFRMFSVENEA